MEASGIPTRVVLRIIVILIAVMIVLWVISKITGIILLLVLSIFFAYLVSPLVEFLRRERIIAKRKIAIPKIVAIVLAYMILFAGIVFVIFVIVPSLSTQFPEFAAQSQAYWNSLGDRTQELVKYSRRLPAPLVAALTTSIPDFQKTVIDTVKDFFSTAFGYVI